MTSYSYTIEIIPNLNWNVHADAVVGKVNGEVVETAVLLVVLVADGAVVVFGVIVVVIVFAGPAFVVPLAIIASKQIK